MKHCTVKFDMTNNMLLNMFAGSRSRTAEYIFQDGVLSLIQFTTIFEEFVTIYCCFDNTIQNQSFTWGEKTKTSEILFITFLYRAWGEKIPHLKKRDELQIINSILHTENAWSVF